MNQLTSYLQTSSYQLVNQESMLMSLTLNNLQNAVSGNYTMEFCLDVTTPPIQDKDFIDFGVIFKPAEPIVQTIWDGVRFKFQFNAPTATKNSFNRLLQTTSNSTGLQATPQATNTTKTNVTAPINVYTYVPVVEDLWFQGN